MKNSLLMLIFVVGCFREPNLSAIDYTTFSVWDNGKAPINLKNHIRVAYYKDYMLYRTTTIVSSTKGSSSNTEIYLNDTTGTKVYSYYVLRNSARKGLTFSTLYKKKIFDRAEFLNASGLNFKDSPFFNLELGIPDRVEINPNTGEIELEKYLNKNKGSEEPDSLYRYYDHDLASLNFSFNPTLDKKQKSKLWKISLIYSGMPKPPSGGAEKPRTEAYWKFEKSTLTQSESDTLMKVFNKFIVEEKLWDLR